MGCITSTFRESGILVDVYNIARKANRLWINMKRWVLRFKSQVPELESGSGSGMLVIIV
jgi:hypothetical protein